MTPEELEAALGIPLRHVERVTILRRHEDGFRALIALRELDGEDHYGGDGLIHRHACHTHCDCGGFR